MAEKDEFIVYLIQIGNSTVDRYHIKINESDPEKTYMLPFGPYKQTCHQDDTPQECYLRKDYVEIFRFAWNHVPVYFSVTAIDELGGLHQTPSILIKPSDPSKRAFIEVHIVKIDEGYRLATSDWQP